MTPPSNEFRIWKKSKFRWDARVFVFNESSIEWQGRKKRKVIELKSIVAVADNGDEAPNALLKGSGFLMEVEREGAKVNRTYTLCAVSPQQRAQVVKLLSRSKEKKQEALPVEFSILIGAPKDLCESMSKQLRKEVSEVPCAMEFVGGQDVCQLKLRAKTKDDLRSAKRLAHRWVDGLTSHYQAQLEAREAAPSVDLGASAGGRLTVKVDDMLRDLELDDDF